MCVLCCAVLAESTQPDTKDAKDETSIIWRRRKQIWKAKTNKNSTTDVDDGSLIEHISMEIIQ